MADHFISLESIRRLANSRIKDGEAILIIDGKRRDYTSLVLLLALIGRLWIMAIGITSMRAILLALYRASYLCEKI